MAQQSLPASSNLNSENATAAPESVDVAEAVALMADLGEAGEDEAEETAPAKEGAADDAVAKTAGKRARPPRKRPTKKPKRRPRAAMLPNSGAPRTRRPGMPCRPSCVRC